MARSSSRLRHVFQFLAAFLILWAQERFSPGSKKPLLEKSMKMPCRSNTVSYTHLTLPTILRV